MKERVGAGAARGMGWDGVFASLGVGGWGFVE